MFETADRFRWVDFLDFLRTYDLAASVIRTRRGLPATSRTSTSWAAPRAPSIVELIVSPDHARSQSGSSDASSSTGRSPAGIDDARRDHGIEARILIAADAQLRRRARNRDRPPLTRDRHPYVVGFNLAGDEAGYPPALFRGGVPIAGVGLGCTRARGVHAGAASVRGALDAPGHARLAGVRAIEDPALVAGDRARADRARGLPDVNVATGVFPSLRSTHFRVLREAGCDAHVGF